MPKYLFKNKESDEIDMAKKKGGWTSLSFCRVEPDSWVRGAQGTARQKKKEIHIPFFLAMYFLYFLKNI